MSLYFHFHFFRLRKGTANFPIILSEFTCNILLTYCRPFFVFHGEQIFCIEVKFFYIFALFHVKFFEL